MHEHSLLVTHLKRHMVLEEEVLYPAYESTLHAPQGPTTALQEGHDNIVRLIQGMAQIIRAGGSEHALEALAQLVFPMIKHHEKSRIFSAHGQPLSECKP